MENVLIFYFVPVFKKILDFNLGYYIKLKKYAIFEKANFIQNAKNVSCEIGSLE